MESKNERIAEILQKKLIVIVRGLPRQQLRKTAQALYDGGIRFLEITYSASGAVTDGQTAVRIAMLTDAFGTSMHIGAGTVLTEAVSYTHLDVYKRQLWPASPRTKG